jgi:uncharacterized protein (TIGR02271 family)
VTLGPHDRTVDQDAGRTTTRELDMIAGQDIDRVLDATAYDNEGDRIGSVETIYVDDRTDEAKFVLVNTGLFGMNSSFVPLEGARMDGDDLRLAFSKDQVKDAPNLDPEGHLEPAQEEELYSYYAMDRGDAADAAAPRSGSPSGTVGHDTSGPETDEAMTRSEEELQVGTTERETGRVRLRKHVVTEQVTKTVPVQREEVRVEREPITDANVDAATDGPGISEEEHEVVLHEEEPVVAKRTVPKERVRLDKEVHTDEEQVSEDVAHEEIELVDEDATRRDR